MTSIALSWPPRPLWANWRGRWQDQRAATRAYRQEAWGESLRAKVKPADGAILTFHFHPPDRRKRDISNMPHTQKAAIDGIADVLRCDDTFIGCQWPIFFAEPVKGGRVVIQIHPVNI